MVDDVIASGQGPKVSEVGTEEGDALVFLIYVHIYLGLFCSDAHFSKSSAQMMDLKRVFKEMAGWSMPIIFTQPLKNPLFSFPAKSEQVWAYKHQSLKTVIATFLSEKDTIAILITSIRLLMFIGDRAKAGLSLLIDFTSKNAHNYCNYFSVSKKNLANRVHLWPFSFKFEYLCWCLSPFCSSVVRDE